MKATLLITTVYVNMSSWSKYSLNSKAQKYLSYKSLEEGCFIQKVKILPIINMTWHPLEMFSGQMSVSLAVISRSTTTYEETVKWHKKLITKSVQAHGSVMRSRRQTARVFFRFFRKKLMSNTFTTLCRLLLMNCFN